MLTQSDLRKEVEYCPKTGDFRWRRWRPGRRQDLSAGTIMGVGYLAIGFRGKTYYAHRLAWLYVYGKWPENYIDHINHDKLDNRIENLKDVSFLANMRNLGRQCNNKTGVTGVSWDSQRGKWYAWIKGKDKTISLGRHTTLFDAACARKSAEQKYGYHPNHGQIAQN